MKTRALVCLISLLSLTCNVYAQQFEPEKHNGEYGVSSLSKIRECYAYGFKVASGRFECREAYLELSNVDSVLTKFRGNFYRCL